MDNFPFKSNLSLNGLIDYWRDGSEKKNEFEITSASMVDAYVQKHPELLASSITDEVINRHSDFVNFMMSAVIPPVKQGQIAAAYKPFSFEAFYGSDSFWELVNLHGGVEELIGDIPMSVINIQKTVGGYAAILGKFYGD